MSDFDKYWREPLLKLSDEKLIEYTKRPGTDLDWYLIAVFSEEILRERGIDV